MTQDDKEWRNREKSPGWSNIEMITSFCLGVTICLALLAWGAMIWGIR